MENINYIFKVTCKKVVDSYALLFRMEWGLGKELAGVCMVVAPTTPTFKEDHTRFHACLMGVAVFCWHVFPRQALPS